MTIVAIILFWQLVLCALPDCAPGVGTAVPPGQCCPVCGE